MGVSADNQSSSNYVGSEDNGGSSDGQCSSPVQSSDDDTVSDEDFRVDEAELHTVCSSDSENNEGIQSRAGIDEEIHCSSDEFDDDYLQFLRCHHGSSSSIQGGNAEIFDTSVNGVHYCSNNGSFIQPSPLPCRLNAKSGATKRRGRPPKNTIVVIDSESEADTDSIGEFGDINDGDELYLEWLGSHGLSRGCGNGGNRKRGRPLKGMNVGVDAETENYVKARNGGYQKRGREAKKTIIETESASDELKPMNGYRKRGGPRKKTIFETDSESQNELFGEIGKFENGGSRERGMLSEFEDVEDGDELYMQWLCNLELSGRRENGGNSKQGRPAKRVNMGVASEPENYGYQQRGRLPENSRCGKGGRMRKRTNMGHQQRGRLPKNGGCGKRGRPRKNWNMGFDSENGGNRERGKRPQFEDVEDGDEMYLRVSRNLKLSGRSENVGVGSEPKNDGHQQRGTLPKNLNKGFDSERGCTRTGVTPPKNLNKGFDFQRGCRRSRRLQAMSRK